MGFWVLVFDVGVKGLGCGVWGGQWLGLRGQGSRFRVQSSGFGFRVYGGYAAPFSTPRALFCSANRGGAGSIGP